MPKKSTINQAKYDAVNCRTYHLKLVYKTDKDIIDKLASVPSMQGYIKQLIRHDLAESAPEKEREENTMEKIREIAQNWIENADHSPVEPIDIETAKQYISWMDPDTVPENMTPEAFMEVWNDIVRT